MTRLAAAVALALLAGRIAAATAVGPAHAAEAEPATTILTVEGTVVDVGEAPGEGELTVTSIRLAGEGTAAVDEVLLAPGPALAEAGFDLAVGDLVRARVFLVPGSRTAYAQKVMNRSRSLMVRLRTLRHEPVWDTAGNWQGTTEVEVRSERPAERGTGPPARPPRTDERSPRPAPPRPQP